MQANISTSIALILLLSVQAFAQDHPSSHDLSDMKAKADEVLKLSIVTARSRVGEVFAYIDLLLEHNHADEARDYLDSALKLYPLNLRYQLAYAQLLMAAGEHDAACQRAEIVMQYGETEALMEPARKLLGKPALPDIEPVSVLPGDGPCLVLIPIMDCDLWLIVRVKERLSEELGIPVYIQSIDAEFPAPARSRRLRVIEQMRGRLKQCLDDPQVRLVMNSLNISADDLEDDAKVVDLVKVLIGNADEVSKLEESLAEAATRNAQYNVSDMLDVLKAAVQPHRRQGVGYLGITNVDIFDKDYSYLFGLGGSQGGIMSYHRFTAEFNNQVPDANRLVSRTNKQCLASVGHIFNVARCSDPSCARAYPHSLAEHDAKADTMCTDCKSGFEKAFGAAKAPASEQF